MQTVTTIGFDIAKSVFQVHGVDAGGEVVIRRQLKRRHVLAFFQKLPPCLVGIEACASSHYWSRELQALGHTVRLMPPAYVKPYVKRQKNDMADAEAICEAVTRANMRLRGWWSCLKTRPRRSQPSRSSRLIVKPLNYIPLAGSPTTTNGAQTRG
jgi:transposase